MREINIKALLCWGLIFSGLATKVNAQHNSIVVGGGFSSVLGDANLEFLDWESYGYSITARYIHPFRKTDRWNYTLEYTTSSMIQRGYIDLDLYNSNISQTYIGIGCRFYLFNTIKEYNPYFMELLPFVEAGAGYLKHAMSFEKPFRNTGNFGLAAGSSNGFNFQGTGGILLILDARWGMEFSLAMRYDPSDSWDGLEGKTNTGDVFISGGLGFNYAF